ncbi:hypothetical protein BZA77DRAFT_313207 [Pyronema omphalodes]|nr:hypothetical protein BZA77DRAFT_330150 [Pyronema omphalodes]KAI5816243.1 hypothetical protein BZA77DRAFT_313207 [Pyronema omphalodes]
MSDITTTIISTEDADIVAPVACLSCGRSLGVTCAANSVSSSSGASTANEAAGGSGTDADSEHKKRILELEAEVKLLNDKVCAAENKLLSQDSELRRLRPSSSNGLSPRTPTFPTTPERAPSPASRGKISSFLFPSRSGHPPANGPSGPPSPPPDCIPEELARERSLRKEAEDRLQEVTNELEELSASLFQEANQMVAEERRMRSRLEDRVAVLEKRDEEKRERLGVLEQAVDRISRVREMLTGAVTG